MKDHVDPRLILAEGHSLALAGIAKRLGGDAGVLRQHGAPGTHRLHAGAIAGFEPVNERNVHPADESYSRRAAGQRRQRADEKGTFLLAEAESGEVGRNGPRVTGGVGRHGEVDAGKAHPGIFTDDLQQLATEYPGVRFAGVDFAVPTDAAGHPRPIPANLAALRFREEEGAFLVGALAALAGGSPRVGFVGGMDIPLIHRFEAGYRAGVKAVCPGCTVLAQYAGVTPEAFRDPGKGKEMALRQYQAGVNVIFHASGSTGLGVFEAARQMNRLAIGVDADQYDAAPGHVLTSMVKRVDAVVFDQIGRVQNGTFRGGSFEYGLAQGGIGYVYDARNRGLIPDSVHARVESLRQAIIDRRIVVPAS